MTIQLIIHQSQPNIYTLFWHFDLITRSSSEEAGTQLLLILLAVYYSWLQITNCCFQYTSLCLLINLTHLIPITLLVTHFSHMSYYHSLFLAIHCPSVFCCWLQTHVFHKSFQPFIQPASFHQHFLHRLDFDQISHLDWLFCLVVFWFHVWLLC